MRTARTRANPVRTRGFTLLEVLLVVVIVTVLAALLFVAIGAAVRAVRKAGEQQYVRSLAMAVEQYKQSVGSVPPLVAEGPTESDGPLVMNPAAGTPFRPRIKGEGSAQDLTRAIRYARYEIDADGTNPDLNRSSRYTLAVYVLGVLGKKYDGVEGPGFTKPDTDGVFSRAGATTQPLFDVTRHTERVQRLPVAGSEDDPACRTVILDRWNNPIRYYRWLPTYHTASATVLPSVYPGAPGNAPAQAKEVRSFNVPPGVGNPVTNPELRGAQAAVVSAGPDGQINDADADAPENQDNIVEVVK
ncbi:MAG TPA: prepilin-type N-terminal cleavage/methylation domain-containing protein [Phycisphaerales bacterium]|nr:prepilin-type N-terminal cleavage/methylation domain-containing protein [Phycisphaerales bacterium]